MKPNLFPLLIVLMLALSNAWADEKPVYVTTAPVGSRTFSQEFSAPATTLSLNESRVSAQTSASILEIPVRVGDHVQKGRLLTALDCRQYRARMIQAEAGLQSIEARVTLARRQIKRTKTLRKERNVSEELLNQREAELQTALADRLAQQASIEEATLEVSRCTISAPFTGIVAERLAGEGEWVSPGQPLVRLVDSERLEVSVYVPVDQIASLRAAATFELESNQGRYPLTLRSLVPVIETRGRNREVRFEFLDRRALPGSTGRLIWRSPASYLPADIPVRRDAQMGLFLAEGDKARFHPLPEALEGQPALVSLPAETRLILEGRHALEDGDRIEIKADEP